MSINGIGKGGGLPPVGGPGEAGRAGEVKSPGAEFSVDNLHKAEAGQRVAGGSALEQLRAGTLTLPQYLDVKVREATAHLDGKINGEHMEFVKSSLREQLSSDPVLIDLVKAATGSLPPPQE
jgi:hypothetical protein